MTKTEHLQFLILMIPTFLILAAAAVSMADLAFPADQAPDAVVTAYATAAPAPAWDDRPAE
jgi:hypothetical protein